MIICLVKRLFCRWEFLFSFCMNSPTINFKRMRSYLLHLWCSEEKLTVNTDLNTHERLSSRLIWWKELMSFQMNFHNPWPPNKDQFWLKMHRFLFFFQLKQGGYLKNYKLDGIPKLEKFHNLLFYLDVKFVIFWGLKFWHIDIYNNNFILYYIILVTKHSNYFYLA